MAPIQHQRNRRSPKTTPEGSNKEKKRKKSYKNQLRDVQRLLRQKDIPATVRVAQERMLNMLKDNLTESAKQQKEKKMVKKYKMVKFFEKRKISRMYKSCVNEMSQCTDQPQREELENRLKLLKQQWNYITYFPKEERYISLFPPTPCTNQQILQHQDKVFKLINDKIATEELDDSSDMILQSPKEKKKVKGKSFNKGIQLSSLQDEKDDVEDMQSPTSTVVDDFFIDTTPSEIETSPSNNDGQDDDNSLGLSAVSKSASLHHKVKRLKDERDLVAAKKSKKSKKNK